MGATMKGGVWTLVVFWVTFFIVMFTWSLFRSPIC